jgi:diguanylate cyclase (GGDEF)-like protein
VTSGGRRGLLLLSAALFLLFLAQVVAFRLDADQVRRTAATLTAAGALVVGGLAVALMREPDRFGDTPIQRYLLGGVLAVAAGGFAAQLPSVPPRPAFGLGVLVAGTALYRALNHWNRSQHHIGPGDWLNGLSAVLVGTAITNAVLPIGPAHWDTSRSWAPQAAALGLAVAVVLTGTALTVISIAGLRRDPRVWLIAAAMTGLVAATATGVFAGRATAWPEVQCGAVAGISLLLLACRLPDRAAHSVPATTEDTTRGSIVVIFAGVVSLTVAGGLPRERRELVAGCAALGVLLVSTRLLRLVRDLEQLALARQQALTDELTGIANRRALMESLATRMGEPGACLLIVDVDDFKLVNDRHGHAVGDELLRQLAGVLGLAVPGGALLARLGGDAFAVLLAGCSAADAFERACRLVETVDRAADDAGRPLRTRISVGVAAAADLPRGLSGDRLPPPAEADAAAGADAAGGELLRRANTAAHQARTAHTRVSLYDPAVDARARERQRLVEDLQDVLAPGSDRAGQLEAWYQPQVDVATGAVVGAEALVRWRHPQLGLLTPDRFIDLVEDHGLMPGLTERMLVLAVGTWGRLRDLGRTIRISVNLSASSLAEPGLFAVLDDVTAGRVDPGQLVLEITESALMADPALAIHRMHEITRRGFPISIDDYGTGYSSLSYLTDLPAQELKIDRSFTTRLRTDPRTRAIVAGTIELAHRLDLRLVAEGVEDEQTLAVLREMCCDEAQGYLHSRPLPPSEFESWLLARKVAARTATP